MSQSQPYQVPSRRRGATRAGAEVMAGGAAVDVSNPPSTSANRTNHDGRSRIIQRQQQRGYYDPGNVPLTPVAAAAASSTGGRVRGRDPSVVHHSQNNISSDEDNHSDGLLASSRRLYNTSTAVFAGDYMFVRRSNSKMYYRPDPPPVMSRHDQNLQSLDEYDDDDLSMVTFYYPKQGEEEEGRYDRRYDVEQPPSSASMTTITEHSNDEEECNNLPLSFRHDRSKTKKKASGGKEATKEVEARPTGGVQTSNDDATIDAGGETYGFAAACRAYFKKLIRRHKAIKILQVLLAFYIGLLSYANLDEKTGFLIDPNSQERTERGVILVNDIVERPIVATTYVQLVSIAICRLSAFFMYPALIMVFISKFRATTSFLARTPISLYFRGDPHELHVYCGYTILVCSSLHSIFHCLRWFLQDNLYSLLFRHLTGSTGFMAATTMLLICLPMMYFKETMQYEIRKYMHYLFVIFALCLAFHTSPSVIPNGGFTFYVFGTLLIWWFIDAMYCTFNLTEKIETTKFEVLPNGVQLTMKVSDEFDKRAAQGGFCYVLFPWVDTFQWHAFSLFENPTNPAERQIFLQCNGDWTDQVHATLQRDTVRPVWVQGPFPSPYNIAESYDNQILVASGIGVTPALSVIRAHKDTRRINLIWAVRDRHLLEFFLRHLHLDNSGWNLIFYTGKEPLQEDEIEIFANTNVCIIYGRPNLNCIIPNIIYGIETRNGLPENYTPKNKSKTSQHLANVLLNGTSICAEMMAQVPGITTEHGYEIDDLKSHYNTPISKKKKKPCSSSMETTSRGSIQNHKVDPKQFARENLRLGYKPWEEQEDSNEIKRYVKNLDRRMVKSTWGILYCGGSKVVQSDLKQISRTYKLDLHVESFGW